LPRYARNDAGGRNEGRYRHSRAGGSPVLERDWIPAFAGMTGGGAGMTAFTSGQRPHFQGFALTCVIVRSVATRQSMLAGDDGLPRGIRHCESSEAVAMNIAFAQIVA
jgi:hypothetical protein